MAIEETMRWFSGLPQTTEFQAEQVKADFALALERLLRQAGIRNGDLAARLGTSPAYVTKVLRGDVNLTIETMVKLARAAGGMVHVHIAPQEARMRWLEVVDGSGKTGPEEMRPTVEAWQRIACG
jgi:transcriptional regulator with XRE-family HTH domain